jgi:hypothetical protein
VVLTSDWTPECPAARLRNPPLVGDTPWHPPTLAIVAAISSLVVNRSQLVEGIEEAGA